MNTKRICIEIVVYQVNALGMIADLESELKF